MTRAAMSTIEHGLRHEIEDDMADAQFTGFYAAAALREANMLVERNEPRGGTWYQHACVLECGTSADALKSLAEALAAFIVADIA